MLRNRCFVSPEDDDSEWIKRSGSLVRATIVVIGGRWKPLIIDVLKTGTLRSGALSRRIPRVSRKVLTAQLRELERENIVSRTVLGKKAEHVEYSLTPYGRTLVPVLAVLAEWGGNHLKRKERNQHASRARPNQLPVEAIEFGK